MNHASLLDIEPYVDTENITGNETFPNAAVHLDHEIRSTHGGLRDINSSHAPSNRFYTFSPPFPNEPTRDRFKVIHSESTGEGLISLVDIEPGEVVFTFAGQILDYQTLYTLQIEPGRYIDDPLVMGKVLHSCDPNMICSMKYLTFWARKPIKAGDYLYMDYETTEDELYRHFNCCCGADNCRGLIRGRSYLSHDEIRNIMGFLEVDDVQSA